MCNVVTAVTPASILIHGLHYKLSVRADLVSDQWCRSDRVSSSSASLGAVN